MSIAPTKFTFLHAADLHLGSPLAGLSARNEDVARRFALAGREAFSELVEQALAQKVAFVLIAGDVYDREWKDASVGLFFVQQIARFTRVKIPVFFVRGNHDAESEIAKAVALPEGVREFSSRKAETFRLDDWGVAIHGRSFPDRAVPDNFALTYPAPVSGALNIGLLHTSCDGSGAHKTYAPCSLADLSARGYDYWALGHVHQQAVRQRDPWIVYPGNLQGRSVRECGPKGAMLVDVEHGRISGVRPLVVDRARWLHERVSLEGAEDEADVLRRIDEQMAPALQEAAGRLVALRVSLHGATPLHGLLRARLDDLRDETQARANHLHEDVWLEALKLETTPLMPTGAPAPGALDPEALFAGLEQDACLRQKAEEFRALARQRLPSGVEGVEAFDDLDALIGEARALTGARLAETQNPNRRD